MSKAILFGYTVVVDPGVFLSDGPHLGCDSEAPFAFNNHTVSVTNPSDGHSWCRCGLPPCAFSFLEEYGLSVEGKGEVVSRVFPCCSLLGTNEELVFVKEDCNGLDPSEVPLHVLVSPSNEVGVDVQVGV